MRLHPDTKFTVAAVTAFALVAVLLPMSMLMTGCQMMAIEFHSPMTQHPTISSVCDMVGDPALPDSSVGSAFSIALTFLIALVAAFLAFAMPRVQMVRAVVPVAFAPPPRPPEPPLGQRLRL